MLMEALPKEIYVLSKIGYHDTFRMGLRNAFRIAIRTDYPRKEDSDAHGRLISTRVARPQPQYDAGCD
jgi:hypothetical protein